MKTSDSVPARLAAVVTSQVIVSSRVLPRLFTRLADVSSASPSSGPSPNEGESDTATARLGLASVCTDSTVSTVSTHDSAWVSGAAPVPLLFSATSAVKC